MGEGSRRHHFSEVLGEVARKFGAGFGLAEPEDARDARVSRSREGRLVTAKSVSLRIPVVERRHRICSGGPFGLRATSKTRPPARTQAIGRSHGGVGSPGPPLPSWGSRLRAPPFASSCGACAGRGEGSSGSFHWWSSGLPLYSNVKAWQRGSNRTCRWMAPWVARRRDVVPGLSMVDVSGCLLGDHG